MLVLGIGMRRGVGWRELRAVVEPLLGGRAVGLVVTADRKAHEPGLVDLAAHLGAPLVTYDDAVLAAQPVTAPSATVSRHVGIPSVAEAAALAAGARVVDRARSPLVTAVLGERP